MAAVYLPVMPNNIDKMQKALTMPMVLRAAVTAKRWLAKENRFATSIMEESVDNLHVKCGKHMFNNNFGRFRDFSSDFICGIANKMYLCSAIQENKQSTASVRASVIAPRCVGAFFSSSRYTYIIMYSLTAVFILINNFCSSEQRLVFLFGDTGYGSRFSAYKAKQENKMQKALTMPMVLRAAVTAKRWLAKKNEICSAVMEEKVDNFHVVAVLECIIGIIMACFVMCNIFVAALGFALLAAGTSALARDEEVSAGV